MSGTSRHVSLDELETAFTHELQSNNREAAETAYALAFRYRSADVDGRRRFDLAQVWARRALQLLDGLPDDEICDVVSTRQSVGGVPLPDLFHSALVRHRLADVL